VWFVAYIFCECAYIFNKNLKKIKLDAFIPESEKYFYRVIYLQVFISYISRNLYFRNITTTYRAVQKVNPCWIIN